MYYGGYFWPGQEVVTANLAAGQTVVAFVDAREPDAVGTYEIQIFEVVPTELDCTDGLDTDLDDTIDCLDADCAADPACGPDLPRAVGQHGAGHGGGGDHVPARHGPRQLQRSGGGLGRHRRVRRAGRR